MGIDPVIVLKWSRKDYLRYSSKKNNDSNYFVIYDVDDMIVCYLKNYKELSRYINHAYDQLVYKFNSKNTNIIDVIIDRKEYKLAIFSDDDDYEEF